MQRLKPYLLSISIGISFLVYVVYSYVFYLERLIMPDMAFQLFQILKNDNLAIQINRYGAAMTQLFPLIGCKLNLSLETIAILYSISFPIVYLVIFCIINFGFKQPKIGIIFFLFHFLINTHSFYWPQCELIQGMSILLVYFAFLESRLDFYRYDLWCYFISFILLSFVIFTYPLLILPFLFGIGFLYFYRKFQFKIFAIQVLFLILIFGLKQVYLRNYYDAGAMSGLKNFITLFPNYFTIQSNYNFISYLIHDYYLIIPLWILVNFYTYVVYQLKQMVWFNLFFFGTIFLINICFQQGAEQFYLEGQYSLLAIIIGFPLVYYYSNSKFLSVDYKPLYVCFVTFLFVLRISNSREIYTQRIDFYRNLYTELPFQKKIISADEKAYKNILKLTWGSAYEIWLLSTIETGKTSSILIHDNPSSLQWAMDKNKALITQWEVIDYKDLNPRYMVMKDSSKYLLNDN